MKKVVIETERLMLRELVPEDAPFYFHLVHTPDWLRYIGDRKIDSIGDAERYLLNGPIASYRQWGFGFYLMELRESEIPVGLCGLAKRDELEDVDIGFALLPQYTGQGYGYEAAVAMLDLAENALKLPRVIAITTSDNKRSIQLLRKLGMVEEGTVGFAGEDMLLFGINFG